MWLRATESLPTQRSRDGKIAGPRFVATRYSIRRVSRVSTAVLPSRLREEAVVRDSAKWVTRMVARRRYDWLSLLTQRTRPGVVASKQPAGVSVVGQPVCQRWTWSDSRLFPCYDRFDRGAAPLFRRGGMKRGWIIFHLIYSRDICVPWWQCVFFLSFFLSVRWILSRIISFGDKEDFQRWEKIIATRRFYKEERLKDCTT